LDIPFCRFVQLGRFLGTVEEQELIDSYKQTAYAGWLNYLNTPVEKKGKKKMGYEKYLKSVGLGETKKSAPQLSEEEKTALREHAISKAGKIVQMDSKRRMNKGG